MPNPYGNLAGFSDPEEAGWQERALERVRARQKKTHRNNERKSGMYLFYDDPFKALLDEACKRRDISFVGYGRRATGAFISHDLGIPFSEVMQYAAQPSNYARTFGGSKQTTTNDNGQGRGLWIIGDLK